MMGTDQLRHQLRSVIADTTGFEGRNYRVADSLARSDTVMNNTFWIGVFPALNEEMLDYAAKKISEFMGAGF